MARPSLHPLVLALSLIFAPASGVLAGQTIPINGTVNHDVYGNGDAADNGRAPGDNPANLANSPDGNTVSVTGGTVDGAVLGVFGGYAESTSGDATASNNTVTVSDSRVGDSLGVGGDIFGGRTLSVPGSATASNNTVTVSGSDVSSIHGGSADNYDPYSSGRAEASNNTVTVSGGTVKDRITGGSADSEGSGGADTSNNNIIIDGSAVGGSVEGGDAESYGVGTVTALNNTLTIRNSAIGGDVQGGDADSSGIGAATASNNTVTLSGSTVGGDVEGGLAESASGFATASNNSVIVTGGTVGGDIYGGMSDSSGSGDSSKATENSVSISGGTVNRIFGGFVNGGPGDATGNTVNLGPGTVAIGGNLYGGLIGGLPGFGAASSGDAFTGNTLNLQSAKGVTVGGDLKNFENLNFHFPENTQAGDTILTVTGAADIRGSTVSIGIEGGNPTLAVGEAVNLIDAGTLDADATIKKVKGLQGSTIEYEFAAQQSGNKLVSTVTSRSAAEASKSVSEGFIASSVALVQASDFASKEGTSAAVSSVAAAGGAAAGAQGFGAMGGGSIRNNTGSHVDVDGYNIVVGVAVGNRVDAGELIVGGFFEYGDGNYSSYNDFSTGRVKGKGDTQYRGLGVLARLALDSGVYLEGSVRGGKVEQDFHSNEIRPGTRVSYDSDSRYTGAHIGIGKEWTLAPDLGVDSYAQYIWQRQDGDTARLSTGETVKFKAVDSSRLRLGLRLNKAFTSKMTGYVGTAYENEFDGKAKATTNGLSIESPSMKGDSGMLELGVTASPLANGALTLEAGVQGYAGQKEGVTGSLKVNYKF
jgi:outer membrane autotransporter protein